MERERREKGEKRARTDMDTDVESTQSRQKQGQMKSIFLSDSDEEAIVEFVKQHEVLYDKTNNSFKDKQNKERLWSRLQLQETCLSRLGRSGLRLNVPDMASSLRRNQDKQLRRAHNDRPG